MTITYATGVGGYSARRFVCTHSDPLCSDSAVVIVLEDGRWYGYALCADHAPTSALQPHAAAEPARGCTPPAATEGQGAVHPSAAPAPGGPTYTGEDLARALQVPHYRVLTHRWADYFGMVHPSSGHGRQYRFTIGQLVAARCCAGMTTRGDNSPSTRRLIEQVCRHATEEVDRGLDHPWLILRPDDTWSVLLTNSPADALPATGAVMVHIFDLQRALDELVDEGVVRLDVAA